MTASLHAIVARVLEVPPAEVHDDMGPKTARHWTSLKHIQLIAAVEDAYGIQITPREIRSVRTVAGLRMLVQAKNGTV